ncbi:MAG: tetratricopeptide repeat protein [Bacteriovoracia bacterium]
MSATSTILDVAKINEWIKQKDFDAAKQECEKVVHALIDTFSSNTNWQNTELKTAMHLLGTISYLSGNLQKGIELFKKILELDPKHTDAAISLSIIYNDIGKYDEAKKIYQLANQSLNTKRAGADPLLDRKFAVKHIEIGDLYFKYHRYDDALEDYMRAQKLLSPKDPQTVEIRIKLAKCYAKKGFTTRSIQELQQLCVEFPNDLQGRIHLGLMYYSQGNIIDAQLEWERAAAIDPSNEEIKTYLSMTTKATETNV